MFWLLLLYPTIEIDTMPTYPVTELQLMVPSFQILWRSLKPVLLTFQPLNIWLGTTFCGALLWHYRRRINSTAVGLLGLAALGYLVGMNVLPFHSNQIRQYFILGALLSLLAGIALGSLLYAGQDALSRLGLPANSRGRVLVPTALCLLLAISLLPSYRKSDTLVHRYTLHDRRNDLANYFDTSLEPALTVAHAHMYNTFNRAWHGYTGKHDIPMYPGYAWLYDKPIDDWRAAGIEYAIMPHWRMLEDPDSYHPDETVLLKTYPVDGSFRGPDMVVLRLYPMQYQTDQLLGPVRLVGYDINSTQLQAGEDILLRHYWRADHPTSTAHHVYNHLLDAAGEIVSQTDYVPLWDSRRDTTSWDDPDEIMLGREFELSLPADLPPGAYQLISGFYDPLTWQRLSSPEGADYLSITEITVTQADA